MKLSTKSSCSLSTMPIIVDLDNHDAYIPTDNDEVSRPSSLDLGPSSTRTLRRKKHLSIYRISAPVGSTVAEEPTDLDIPIAQRPVSQPCLSKSSPSSPPAPRPLFIPITKTQIHTRSHSTPDAIRLGHPNRPYYGAIRNNMSRPTSIIEYSHCSPPASSRPTSILLSSPPGLSRLPQATEDEIFVPPAMSPLSSISPTSSSTAYSPFGGFGFLSPVSRSGHRSGGSLSGETEMRMALAREDADDEYRFHDTVKKGGTLKKLGQGLKGIVRRKV